MVMIKKLFVLLFFLFPAALFAQQREPAPPKFALVIGNGAYTYLASLANPVNDANDVAAVLGELGFSVDKVINGSLEHMETAIERLASRLSASKGAYGFIFYAGHGVQLNGENYLIPVNANIKSDHDLRIRSVSVQYMLGELNDAKNSLNVVVLDACRDNPFGWSRNAGRGLAIISDQPADSIIVFATSSGKTASDGDGRNGLFTSQLLPNLKMHDLDVNEVFKRTSADVQKVSNRQQTPNIQLQFFGTAYLGNPPAVQPPAVQPPPAIEAALKNPAAGRLEILTVTAGALQITGTDTYQIVDLPALGFYNFENILPGEYSIRMQYADGRSEYRIVNVGQSETVKLELNYVLPPAPYTAPLPDTQPQSPPLYVPSLPVQEDRPASAESPDAFLNTIGVSVGTSFSAPWVIATLHGTIASAQYVFFDLGVDFGMISGIDDVRYFSVYPFARLAFFMPFGSALRWCGGVGGGYMFSTYKFPEGGTNEGVYALDISTGFIINDIYIISYSLRTNFKSANNKIAMGIIKRF